MTGLANRRLFLDHLDHALLQADRTGSQVAVLFGDIDRFKVVNDNLGHQVGDELLRVIGDRLRRAGPGRRHAVPLRRRRVRHPARGHHLGR